MPHGATPKHDRLRSRVADERTWDVFVVGSAYWDVLVRGPELPTPGRSLQGTALQEAPGGRGANQAVAAARLGAGVALATCVGRDARGECIRQRLEHEGVDTRHVTIDESAPTGVAAIQVGGDGEKQLLGFPGASSTLAHLDTSSIAAALRRASVLLMQLEATVDVVTALAAAAHEAGCRVVLDAAPPEPLTDALMERLYLFRSNAEEAGVITGIAVSDRESARRAASTLLGRGATAACIEAGPAGDLLVWRSTDGSEREIWLPHFPVAAIDSTGAGDAFSATLAVMAARHEDLRTGARCASAAAALTTTRLGAQAAFPSMAEVVDLVQ